MEEIKILQFPNNLITPEQLKEPCLKREERKDTVRNRRKILDTARRLFEEYGVENVTMSEIAQVAGLGKGTLYRHYAYKAQLCLALLEDEGALFQNEVIHDFGEEGQKLTPLGRLQLFIERYLDFVEQNHTLLEAVFVSLTEQQKHDIYRHSAYDSHRLSMLVLLKEAIASGECRADLDVDYAADALLAPLQTNLFIHQRRTLGFSLERIKAGMKQILAGIVA